MSSDGGAVWTQIDSLWYNDGGCVIGHPDSANVVITGGQETDGDVGVSVSRDGGATWTRLSLSTGASGFCRALAPAPSASRTVYAGGEENGGGAVYRSTDLGTSWSRTATAPPLVVSGLAVDPTDPARVFAATRSGLHRTTDAGESWAQVGSTLDLCAVRFLSADGDTLAAGGNSGAFLSTDGGTNWTDITAGLDGNGVACLDLAERSGSVLIAGTRDASCWLWESGAGVGERPYPESGATRLPTIVRGVLYIPPSPFPLPEGEEHEVRGRAALLDITGRRVMDLVPGENDVSRLAPGVYFVRQEAQAQAPAVRKVILTTRRMQ